MILLLALLLVVCIALIPIGLPGTILMLAVAFCFRLLGAVHIATSALVIAVVLALVAEGLDLWVSARYTKKYGGSRRAGWGAIVGGFIGALIGVPVPIVGSVIGGFAGAFVGAMVAEWTRRDPAGNPTRVATGALLGRAAGAAIKTGFGVAIAATLIFAAL